ncbi:hypothetical protein [Burkholderia pyrrocinia]|uniref:hypothetical protein n=1 Tax=Burkholderia pyrrocinia TaxID=60550 RepID=UPI0032650215
MKQLSSVFFGVCAAACLSMSAPSFAAIDLMPKEVMVDAKARPCRWSTTAIGPST